MHDCQSFIAERRQGSRGAAKLHHQQPRFDDAAWVGFRLTELLPFNNAVKQKMLELTDARIRLEILYKFLLDQRLMR